ncbi:MAG TPA: class I SAM-dependent methyltransferase [Acidimicrobiia bacterium]|jgi:SAM-dependent methyltransferase
MASLIGGSARAGLSARLERNRALWSEVNAQFTDGDADTRWSTSEISWGLFRIPETELGVLGDVAGQNVLELGCGTAYLSAWLARAGARVVAVDLSRAQLATAARCQRRYGPTFPLVEADAERVPLRGDAFDLVVSEYGASPWCDPVPWVWEAARLLRTGGRLAFLTSSVLTALCVPDAAGPAGETLLRPQSDVTSVTWPGGGTEFHPGHGAWIRLLGATGFAVEVLHELYAPPGAAPPEYYDIATVGWASRWPAEDLWVARKT